MNETNKKYNQILYNAKEYDTQDEIGGSTKTQ